MANLGAGRPNLQPGRPSSRLSSAASNYYTDAGTITPRGSIDAGRDTETESQYFSDAHSNFPNQSTASLGNYTPMAQPHPPIMTPQAGQRASTEAENEQEELQEGQQTPRAASIDEATRKAYSQEPTDTAEAASTSHKADLAEEAAGLVNRQTATQAPMVDVMKEDSAIPSQAEQSATTEVATGEREAQVPKEEVVNKTPSRESSNTAFVPGEKAAEKPESTSVEIDEKGKKAKKKGKKTKEEKEREKNPEDDPDLAHFTPEQKKIIIDQVDMRLKGKKIGYLDIYRFSTKYELLLDAVGIVAAIASGVV